MEEMERNKRNAEKVVLQASQQTNALIASRESLKSIEKVFQQRELQLQSTWTQMKARSVETFQASKEPLTAVDSVLSEIMTMSLPMRNLVLYTTPIGLFSKLRMIFSFVLLSTDFLLELDD